MKIYALDFETANPDYSSICQFGLAEFTDGKLTDTFVTLIDPETYFDPHNIKIHKIDQEKVEGKPTFEIVHEKLKAIAGEIVLHHSSFDRTAYRQACERYELEPENISFLDTTKVVRRTWLQYKSKGYGLKNIANFLGIDYNSHDALEDAKACGQVFFEAAKFSGNDALEWLKIVSTPYYYPSTIAMDGNPEGEHYGEIIVFTGTLGVLRKEAAAMAAKLGFKVVDGVTKNVDILVIGIQDLEKLRGHDKSSKHRKAIDLKEKGSDIQIISEKTFIGYFEDVPEFKDIVQAGPKKIQTKITRNDSNIEVSIGVNMIQKENNDGGPLSPEAQQIANMLNSLEEDRQSLIQNIKEVPSSVKRELYKEYYSKLSVLYERIYNGEVDDCASLAIGLDMSIGSLIENLHELNNNKISLPEFFSEVLQEVDYVEDEMTESKDDIRTMKLAKEMFDTFEKLRERVTELGQKG